VLLPSEFREGEMNVKVIVLSESLLNFSQVLRSHVLNCCIRFPVKFEQGYRAAPLTLCCCSTNIWVHMKSHEMSGLRLLTATSNHLNF